MRIRFRVRWMLIAITIVALGFGGVMSVVRQADEQRRFCHLVRSRGGEVDFPYSRVDVAFVETATASDGSAEGFISRRLIDHFGTDGWGTLESLYLSPEVDDDATHKILSAARDFPSIATIVFDGPTISEDTVEHLNRLPRLRQLVLRRRVVEESVLGLLESPHLQHLVIEETSAGQWTWKFFNQLLRLSSIDIVLGRIDTSKLANALRSRRMDRLVLNSVDAEGDLASVFHIPCDSLSVYDMPVTDEDVSEIASNMRLRRLVLQGTDVTDQSADAIARKALEHLDLSNTSISDDSIPKIAQLRPLRSLELDGTRITDEGLAMLAQMQNLWSITYSIGSGFTTQAHNQFGSRAPRLKIYSSRDGVFRWIVRTEGD